MARRAIEHGSADHAKERPGWRALPIAFASIAILLIAACGSVADPITRVDTADIIWLEAEEASESGPMVTMDDEQASGGRYLGATDELGTASHDDEHASLGFNVGWGGNYALWVRWYAPSSDADAAFIGFDGETARTFPSVHGRYVWTKVDSHQLGQGAHRVSVAVAETGVQIDLFAVTELDVDAAELEALLVSEERLVPDAPTPPAADDPTEPDHDATPPSDDDPSEPDDDPTVTDSTAMQLRGNPSFNRSSLTSAQRLWYDRTWAALENPSSDADDWAASGDLYQYGRYLNNHVNNILLAFRVTGDLGFLDEIDRLSRYMEAQLADAWVDGTTDGYLNWLWFRGGNETYDGKDTNKMDEALTHANVAAMAYALHANRDLASPAGIDYGARADFWYRYLRDHFEPKWRERRDNPIGFPIMMPNNLAHSLSQWARYHHYMGLLSGDNGYTVEAERLATIVDDNFARTSTPQGDAFVWCHSTSSCLGAQPTNYAGYTVNAMVDLTFEGVGPFTVEDHLESLATTVSYYVVDNGIVDLADNVVGGEAWNGYEAVDDRHLVKSLFALTVLTKFEKSGELDRVIGDLYEENESHLDAPQRIEIPVARLLQASL